MLFYRKVLRIMATLEDQVLQVLANQATIIGNQGAILSAIKGITPGGSEEVAAALSQIETQVTAIQGQFNPTGAPQPAPAPEPAPETPPATVTPAA